MSATQDIRSLISDPDFGLLIRITNRHKEMASLLHTIPECIATINKIVHVAVSHENFIFQGRNIEENKPFIIEGTFHDSLVQVAHEACVALESTIELLSEVHIAIGQIGDVLPDVLNNATDSDTCIEIADAIACHSEVCLSLLQCSTGKCTAVTTSLDKVIVLLVNNQSSHKHFNTITENIMAATTEGRQKLELLKEKWAKLFTFMYNIAGISRGNLVHDSVAFHDALVKMTGSVLATRKDFATKAVKLTVTSAHILALIQTYIEVFELFKQTLHDTSQEIRGKCSDIRLSELAEESQKYDSNAINQIVEAKKQEMYDTIKKSLETLRNSEGGGQYDKILRSMIIGEGANEVAIKHVELETLLTAAPESIMLLSKLCLISTSTKDFQLQPPITGYKFATTNWFRSCLLQVMNKGSLAFMSASKNLAQIETLSRGIPGSVMDIFDLIVNGELGDIEKMLPEMLREIVQVGSKCNSLAQEVSQLFAAMVELINEIKVSCTATRSVAESDKPDAAVSLGILQSESSKVINVLMDGLKALIKIQMQWNKLIRFFDELTKLIRVEMLEPMEGFKLLVQESAESRIKRKKAVSTWVKETLRYRAQDLAQKGCEVHMITTMYLEISKKHVQIPLMTLDSLLTITDPAEANKLQLTLIDTCKQSQREITAMAKRHKEESFVTIRKKMKEIEKKGDEVFGEVNEDDDEEEDYYYYNDGGKGDGGEGGEGESIVNKEAFEDMMVELEMAKLTEEAVINNA